MSPLQREKLAALLIQGSISIRQAVQKLNDTGEKILFVVEESGRLVGTVTDGDIRRGIIQGIDFDSSIRRVMQTHYAVLSRANPELAETAREIMLQKKVAQIPVLNEKGVIVDIILWTDVLKEKEVVVVPQEHANLVVVMAGGRGTRLDPFTKILPKPLIPVGNKPLVEIIMDRFSRYGFRRFVYTLNYKKEYMKLYLNEKSSCYGIGWVEEEEFLGTAGSLLLLRDRLTDTFFVTNCDTLLEVNFEEILKWHKDHKAAVTVIGCHNEVKIPFGVIQMNNGMLERLSEKPVHDVIINTGVYVMEPGVIDYIRKRETLDMNVLIERVAQRETVSVYPIYGGWLDIGKWEEYQKNIRKIAEFDDA